MSTDPNVIASAIVLDVLELVKESGFDPESPQDWASITNIETLLNLAAASGYARGLREAADILREAEA